MQRSILAVSPNLQFLEQIRSHLEEGGRYRVQGVTSGSDALSLVSNNYYDLAILDAESSDVPFVPFTRDLVGIQPGLKLLVFPPQNNPHHPVLTGLVANGFLNKPFFTPEVSRALKNIFQEIVDDAETEPEPTNDLAKLWMQQPEMGIKRVEQLLGSTTAHTGLLVSQGKVIAGSGPSDDATIQTALNLLANHNVNKESMELLRFVPLENEGGELLMYASQLINGITLVLFYPSSSSIQLVRQEVYQVKEEFKQAYPTTGELRRDLEVSPAPPSDESPETKLETNQPTTAAAPISEASIEELIPLEDEIGSDELDSILSQIELKNLDAMLADMPAPDPDVEKPVIDEQPEESPAFEAEEMETSAWVPLADFQEEKPESAQLPQDFTEEEVVEAETTPDLAERSAAAIPPPLPAEFLELQSQIESSDSDVPDTINTPSPETEPANNWIDEGEKAENFEETTEVSPAPASFDFNLPWETEEPQAEKPIEETQEVEGAINETEVDFSSWVENAPASDSFKEPVESAPSTPLAEEPLLSEEAAPEMDYSFEPSAAEEEIASLIDEDEFLPETVDFEGETPDLQTDEGSVPQSISAEYETGNWEESQEVNTLSPQIEGEVPIQEEPVEEVSALPDQPPPLPLESYNTNLSTEPGTSPLGVRNFRFNYTCLLIPRDPKQFLTRDLSERLSFLLPQLHLEYGLRLTGITIRPQYMLWSVSLPIDACPIHTVRDIRRRTTAHITSNFTDLTPLGNGDDFWAPGFLILSGHTSPAVGMIYDFISQTRANQSLND